MKKTLTIILALALMLSASGCGSLFSSEYYYSEPYREEVSIGDGTETEVRNYATLKSAILRLVHAGESHGQFRFGSYSGSLLDDLAAVCHEIKTSTPIGVYAVENISYDTSRIVSYYTADIEIEYRKSAEEIASVVSVNGLGELGSHILSVMGDYSPSTVVKIYSSAASEEYIREFIRDSYYADPFLMAELPEFTVLAYPDFGPERIYVIDFRYSAMPERLREMDELLRSRVEELVESLGEDDPLSLALRCAGGLSDMCRNTSEESSWPGTAYGCIVEGDENPVSLAVGYKALCDMLGIDCEVVLGERIGNAGEVHAWNIICLDDEYYHVDVSRFYADAASAFLLSDEDIWGEYDWDRERYPACRGSLGPEDIFEIPQDDVAEGDEPVTTEPPQESDSPEMPDSGDEPGVPLEPEVPETEKPVE